jgi:ferredoxin
MIYVDENLCTGCGTCLDICNRSAISLDGSTASIAQESCTSCGRCVDMCPAGAIIQVEPVEAASSAIPRASATSVPQTTPTSAPALPTAVLTGSPARASRLASIERLLTGILGIIGSACELKRAASYPGRLIPSGGRCSGGRHSAVGPAHGCRAEAGQGRRHERRRSGRAHGRM